MKHLIRAAAGALLIPAFVLAAALPRRKHRKPFASVS